MAAPAYWLSARILALTRRWSAASWWVRPASGSRAGKAALHDPLLAAQAQKRLLANSNRALPRLAAAIEHPDVQRPLAPYGERFEPSDLAAIPERDLPAGLPAWMRSLDEWATRQPNPAIPGDPKRATLVITVPKAERPWL